MEAPVLVAEWGGPSFRLLHPLVLFLRQGGLPLAQEQDQGPLKGREGSPWGGSFTRTEAL